MAISIEEKQKSLYAALIRYSSDTQSLRERSIDHLVLIGLQDTDANNAVRAGDLRVTIGRGVGTAGIRIEYVLESLTRLIQRGFVEEIKLNHKPHYFVIDLGKKELAKLIDESQKIIKPCIDGILVNFESALDYEVLFRAGKKFIINSFVEYGHSLAQCVTGEMHHADISHVINIEKIFAKSTSDIKFNIEEREGFLSRCYSFLRSPEKRDVEVKFLLTQAYYLAKMFEIDDRDFDPLAQDSFRDAIIYLDTNVVFESILDSDNNRYFDELIAVASKLGIQLCVTQETLEEAYRVLRSKIPALEKIFSVVPERLYKNTKDHVIQGYVSFLERDQHASPASFIESLGDIRTMLEQRGVNYVEMNVEKDFDIRELNQISELVALVANETRGFNKSGHVAKHDAAHLMLVKRNRGLGKKSWFLTKDKTLTDNRLRLGLKRPLYFSLSSLIQCISPFAQESQPDSLFNLFERVLENDISVRGVNSLFELSELQIISEYHQDILSTEPEQLNLAFDYVKSSLLNGQEITNKNQHKVSLEIKKFLKSSVDEQKLAMQKEIARKSQEVEAVRDALLEKEEFERELLSEKTQLELDLGQEKFSSLSNRKKALILRSILSAVGFIIFVPFIILNGEISSALDFILSSKNLHLSNTNSLVWIAGAIFILASSAPLCFCFEKSTRNCAMAIMIALLLYISPLFPEALLTTVQTYFGAAVLIVAAIMWVVRKNKGNNEDA